MNITGSVPFLKWPGGKKWLANRIAEIVSNDYDHFFEPFIGGGAVFFKISPTKAVISDINEELINLYISMRDFPELLKVQLLAHQEKHCERYYYEVRAQQPEERIIRAGRFLYLNRACYNGMYRVNQNGKFNVPIGTKTNFIYDIDNFSIYSNILKNAEIHNRDFGLVISEVKDRDLVFVDPPYTIAHNQNSFIKYNEKLFTWDDQKRLLGDLTAAKERGAKIILTNANYKDIYEMYASNGFNVAILERHCSIAGMPSKRSSTEELLITSFSIK